MSLQRNSGMLWFARDSLGHVAVFESGSAGPIPKTLKGQAHSNDTLANILTFVNHSLVELSYRGHLEPGRDSGVNVPRNITGKLGTVLAFCQASSDELLKYPNFQTSWLQKSDEHTALLITENSKEFLQELAADQRLLASFWPAKNWPLMQQLAQSGIFCYSHLSEAWTAGPYGRHSSPTQPRHFDEIDWLVEPSELTIFDFQNLNFQDYPRLQIAELTECTGVEMGYLDLQGELQI